MENLTVEKLSEIISKWERDAGESFKDYFMHDSVKDNSWAFWLLGKGYHERANAIIDLLIEGETCLDQSLLYEINYSVINDDYGDCGEKYIDELGYDKAMNLYDKDITLWSEFLLSNKYYEKKIKEWILENSKH